MKDLREILDHILKKTPQYEKKTKEMAVFARWEEVVGAKIAQHTRPVRITPEGVLVIAAANSSWNHHLKFLEKQILQKLHKILQSDEIKSLRFYIG